MKRSRQAKEGLRSLLKGTRTARSRIDLKTEIQRHHPRIRGKHILKALDKLVARGLVERRGEDSYQWVDSSSSSSSSAGEGSGKYDSSLTMGELLRRRAASDRTPEAPEKTATTESNKQEIETVDIDEEIRRLEAELANDVESEEGSEVEDDQDQDSSSDRRIRFGPNSVREIDAFVASCPADETEVVCLSEVAMERIEPLPASCLPQSKRRKLKGIDGDEDTKKKEPKTGMTSQGLEEAVKEVLSGYVARSSERLPFYCRVCAKQYSDQTGFLQHKRTEFHRKAVEMERKGSYCKLCRKQFTSPVQLKEHLSSRPHRERLQMLKSSQRKGSSQQRSGVREARNDKPLGGRSQRQWC